MSYFDKLVFVGLLMGFFIGLLVGHYTTKDEEQKKAQKRKQMKFCPRCGESLEPK